MVAILADPGYSMKEHFAFTVHLLFLKQRVTSMLNYATLLGKILLTCNLLQHGEIDDCIALLLHGRDLNDIIYTGNYAWTLTKDPELKGRPKL